MAKGKRPAKKAKSKKTVNVKKSATKTVELKTTKKIPNVWQLGRRTGSLLWDHKELFIGVTLIYGLLNLILVHGLAGNTDVNTLKSALDQGFKGHLGELASGLSVFLVLVGSAGNGSSQT